MKKTIYKKILAAGSALLVLLSLAGCVREEPVQADDDLLQLRAYPVRVHAQPHPGR